MFRRWVGVVAVMAVLVAVFAGTAFAQTKAAAPAAAPQAKAALPTGEALLAKYVQAVGGQAAFEKIKNRVAQGTLDLGAAGITMSVSVYAAKPGLMYTVADSDMTGRIESGVVDGIAWENSAMRGAIVKDGAEKADGLRDATFDRLIYWKDTVKSAECVGTSDVDGKPAYKVLLTPKVGSAQTLYFDRDSSLIVQMETTMVVSGQSIDIVSKPTDYRDIDGIKTPFKMRQYVMGQERVLTLVKLQHNVDLPADRFALPPAIKALVDKK
jgi:zinc protease